MQFFICEECGDEYPRHLLEDQSGELVSICPKDNCDGLLTAFGGLYLTAIVDVVAQEAASRLLTPEMYGGEEAMMDHDRAHLVRLVLEEPMTPEIQAVIERGEQCGLVFCPSIDEEAVAQTVEGFEFFEGRMIIRECPALEDRIGLPSCRHMGIFREITERYVWEFLSNELPYTCLRHASFPIAEFKRQCQTDCCYDLERLLVA